MAIHSSILPGELHGHRSLAGHSPWGCKELVSTEGLTLSFSFFFFKDGLRIGGERAAAVKESLTCYLGQSSLTSTLLTFWAGPLFVVGSVLSPAGLSAASPASIR